MKTFNLPQSMVDEGDKVLQNMMSIGGKEPQKKGEPS
jgi:hypothetical protein